MKSSKFLNPKMVVMFSISSVIGGGYTYAQNGVGIGNNSPQEKLDVTGAIKIGTTATTNAGTIRWNGTNFQGYNGSQWVDLDSQGGADTDWTVSGNNQSSAVSGNVGIGTASPGSKLEVVGTFEAGSSNTVTGTDATAIGQSNSATNTGTFVAGQSSNATGSGSVALGYQANATGNGSIALGGGTASGLFALTGIASTASGVHSVALGFNSTASGDVSVAIGNSSVANANRSMSLSTDGATASGHYSTAMGGGTFARSGYEMAVGRFNTDYSPSTVSGWNNNDRLFVVGNGASSGARSNALTIYKNGKMNINDAYDMPTADGTAGQVLTTNGAGAAAWNYASMISTVPLWNSTTGTGYSMSNTSGAVLNNCENGFIPTTVSATGNVQVKVVLMVSSAAGTNNFQLKSGASYPITSSDTWTWTSLPGGEYVVESQWKSWNPGTTPVKMELFGWTSAGGNATFTNAYVLVKTN